MRTDPHQLRDLADVAWARYLDWLQRLALPRMQQLDLIDASEAGAQVREWRGIWSACEREIVRLGGAHGC